MTAVKNTLVVCALTCGLALPIGTLLSILLVRTSVFGRRLAWLAMCSQLAVPLYVFAGGWSAGFGLQGWFTSLGINSTTALSATPLAASSLQTGMGSVLAVSVIHGLAAIPWVALIVAIGLRFVDRGPEEQASIDGGWRNVLLHGVLPRIRIWIIAAAAWCCVPILTEMVVSNLYQVPTVPEQIYLDASRGSVSGMTYLSAALCCIAPIALFGMFVLWRPSLWRAINSRSQHHQPAVMSLKRWQWPISACLWTVVLILVALPVFSLVAKAGWQPYLDQDGMTRYGWSMTRLGTTIQESLTLFLPEFYWSGLLAIVSSSLAIAVATAVYASGTILIRRLFGLAMLLAIATPGPLVGLWTIWLLNRSEPAILGTLYDQTLAAPVLAQQFRLMPVAWLLVCTIVASISQSTWEQTKLDGLGRIDLLKQVIWPQTGYHWLAAWILLAVLSVGELSCTILVLPPGVTTLAMRLFEMLHFGMRHQDSGLCGLLLLLGWLVSFVFWKTLRER